MRPVVVINPMKSCRPTGIGIAGDAIPDLLPGGEVRVGPLLDRVFSAVNDSRLPGPLRAVLRLGVAQAAPLFYPRSARLVFTSHHAPLWRTGRHAVVIYDTIPLQFPGQAPAQTRYYRRWLPRVLGCAERIVTISAAVRKEFVARGYAMVRTAEVIPAWSPAVDRRIGPGVERARRELLVVGARYPHKNIDIVLTALEMLNREDSSPWRLTLAGVTRELWGRPWGGLGFFEQRGWVRALERVETEELATLYASATALVYPSLAEGQGLPPLEAFAAGCPAVCSDLPVMRETCGDAAFYFPAGDAAALARLLSGMLDVGASEDLRRRQLLGRERLALFGREALAERWRVFLEEWP